MSKKNNNAYWRKRFEDFNKSLEEDEAKLQKRMERYYEKEQKRLEKELQAFYSEYGVNNIVEFREVMLKLGDADRQLLFENYDEFMGKYPQYVKLLPTRENIYKLNRIEGLNLSVLMQQLNIGAKEQEEVEKHLMKQAKKYAKDIQEFYGLGTKFNMEDEQIIKSFVNKAWCDGKSFSDRIWDNKAKLTKYLQNDIAQGIARGDNIEKISKTMMERFEKVSKNDIKRLVYTEDTFMQAESKAELFEENGFITYKFSPANDGNVCPKCEALRDKEFNFEDRQPGLNFPPLHPWCRCTIYTDVDDEGDELTNEELEELGEVMDAFGEPKSKEEFLNNLVKYAKNGIIEVEGNTNISKASSESNKKTFKPRYKVLGEGYINLMPHDLQGEEFKKIPKIKGYTDVICHTDYDGRVLYIDNPQGVSYELNITEFCNLLRQLGLKKGQKVRLFCCSAGKYGDESIAQSIANELGVEVLAPENPIYAFDGDYAVCEKDEVAEIFFALKSRLLNPKLKKFVPK